MRKRKIIAAVALALSASIALPVAQGANLEPAAPLITITETSGTVSTTIPPEAAAFLARAAAGATSLADSALEFLGVTYRFGGNSPERGFDCSGLVRRVFQDALGMNLPRTAQEMSQMGSNVRVEDLKPGDLVFFNTMRRAFSHVGIYLGDNKFVHAPSSGGVVRVEDMRIPYWTQRFNGARRVTN